MLSLVDVVGSDAIRKNPFEGKTLFFMFQRSSVMERDNKDHTKMTINMTRRYLVR